MSCKRFVPAVFMLFCAINCLGQENVEIKNRLDNHIREIYRVLPADQQTKDGPYQAFYRRKHLIVAGNYVKGEKKGVWNFYDTRGALLQTYDFDNDSLEYEAREKPGTDFHYFIDEDATDKDRVTKPIKIGGRLFGYLPYLNAYKTPFSVYGGSEYYIAVVELLISPMGRLAEYKVRLVSPMFAYDQTFELSLNFFKEQDKQFFPATLNYRPIISRIMIKCRVTEEGGLDFF